MNIEQQSFVQAANVATASEPLANKPFGPLRADSNGNLFVRVGAAPLAGGAPASITARAPSVDNVVAADPVGIDTIAYLYGFDGAAWDRLSTANAATLSAVAAPAALMVSAPGEWSITNAPAVAVRATITRAAGGAGVRHVARSITASTSMNNGFIGDLPLLATLRDGTSGVGAILWSSRLQLSANFPFGFPVALSGLNIVGSINTAMTLEFDVAPAAFSSESVALTGFDVT